MSVIIFRDSTVMNQCTANTSVNTPFTSFIQLERDYAKLDMIDSRTGFLFLA
jgi:hypothetical protein